MRRSVAALFVVSTVFIVSFASCAPGDGGDAGVTDCVELCDGDLLVECDADGTEVETDCTVDFNTCSLVNDVPACTVPVGADCLIDLDASTSVVAICDADDGACVDDGDTIVCVDGVANCSASDASTCSGDVLTAECNLGQPFTIDCAAYGAACTGGTGCVSDTGGFCDGVDFFCDSGLTCNDNFLCE